MLTEHVTALDVHRTRPDDLTELDEFLFEGSLDETETDDLVRQRMAWIRMAVSHHMHASTYYGRLARAHEFSPEQLTGPDDLALVPLVSSGAFKARRVATDVGERLKLCLSSGTSGTQSIVPRDDRTLERLMGTVMFGARAFFRSRERRRLLVLGPPTDEAGDLWFSYVLSLGGLINDTLFFVRDGVTRFTELADALESADPDVEQMLIGPPALIVDLLDHLESHGRSPQLTNGFVLTAGGWKKRADERVEREELEQRLVRTLSVPLSRIRDTFNMVELNTVIFECEARVKHVPPWLEVLVRRPHDMSLAEPDETGVLTYLDPTALSYPGFVFSDDLGRLTSGECPCGRSGRFLTIERRVAGIEERGCALKMQRYSESGG